MQIAFLLLYLRYTTGLHARPTINIHATRRVSARSLARMMCADDNSEELAAARRRRDEQALQSEWGTGLSQNAQDRDAELREDELSMLRQRIDLIETKEVTPLPRTRRALPHARQRHLNSTHILRRSALPTSCPPARQTQLGEIKGMLRAMGAPLGLKLVDENDEVTASA